MVEHLQIQISIASVCIAIAIVTCSTYTTSRTFPFIYQQCFFFSKPFAVWTIDKKWKMQWEKNATWNCSRDSHWLYKCVQNHSFRIDACGKHTLDQVANIFRFFLRISLSFSLVLFVLFVYIFFICLFLHVKLQMVSIKSNKKLNGIVKNVYIYRET